MHAAVFTVHEVRQRMSRPRPAARWLHRCSPLPVLPHHRASRTTSRGYSASRPDIRMRHLLTRMPHELCGVNGCRTSRIFAGSTRHGSDHAAHRRNVGNRIFTTFQPLGSQAHQAVRTSAQRCRIGQLVHKLASSRHFSVLFRHFFLIFATSQTQANLISHTYD